MDYNKIYTALINKAKNRVINEYTELHHIIPRCLEGTNRSDNLVYLTPEEHYVAHLLLLKIYPNNKKLIYAAHMMTIGLPQHRRNKAYGWVRRKMSISMSGNGNHMYGKQLSEERKKQSGRSGTSNAFYGKHHSKETKLKISNANKGKPGLTGDKNGMFGKKHKDETKQKISKNNPYTGTVGLHPNNGRKMSDETKDILRKLFSGRKMKEETKLKLKKPKGPQQKITCPHCGKIGGISNLNRYHFNNCKNKK